MHEALLAAWMLEKGHSCTAADICYWAVWAPTRSPLCCHSAEAFKTMWRELRGQLNPGQGWFTIHCNGTTARNAAACGCACMCSHISQVFYDKGHVKLDLKAPSDPKQSSKLNLTSHDTFTQHIQHLSGRTDTCTTTVVPWPPSPHDVKQRWWLYSPFPPSLCNQGFVRISTLSLN